MIKNLKLLSLSQSSLTMALSPELIMQQAVRLMIWSKQWSLTEWLTLKSVYRLENIHSEHQFDEKKSASDLTAGISAEDIPSPDNTNSTEIRSTSPEIYDSKTELMLRTRWEHNTFIIPWIDYVPELRRTESTLGLQLRNMAFSSPSRELL
ncbi:No apical meristem (NAM) protein [Musa troglodytarum]|uniref:No apical meristem (NAM) protein n=1 Tax=Musa troglodytarum TaxID=320322 RepID=A0A9E7EYD9_9LILI|nr:No apical meristem (NAM) protein [Musa troglodytarum]URD85764.1 No apical meristem (NAM) protein [Musa troglodytarum]